MFWNNIYINFFCRFKGLYSIWWEFPESEPRRFSRGHRGKHAALQVSQSDEVWRKRARKMHDMLVRFRGTRWRATFAVYAFISHRVCRPVVANEQTMSYMSRWYWGKGQFGTMRDFAGLVFFLSVCDLWWWTLQFGGKKCRIYLFRGKQALENP